MNVKFYSDVTEEDIRGIFKSVVLESDTVIGYGKYKQSDAKDTTKRIACLILFLPILFYFVTAVYFSIKNGFEVYVTVLFAVAMCLFLYGVVYSVKKLAKNNASVCYVFTNGTIAVKSSASVKPEIYSVDDVLGFMYKRSINLQEIWILKKGEPANEKVFVCYADDAKKVCDEYFRWRNIEYHYLPDVWSVK